MAGRYLPPHLRNSAEEQVIVAPQSPTDNKFSAEEVKRYFWPIEECKAAFSNTLTQSKTMHDAANAPGRLAYILLFHGANPRWETDQILFAKSNLELLPAELAESNTSEAPDGDRDTTQSPTNSNTSEVLTPDESSAVGPIAVFKQWNEGMHGRSFIFEGWYKIERLQFLEPRSPELIRMLDQKWSTTTKSGKVITKTRDTAGWEESLRLRWAVIKLARNEAAETQHGPPKIEKLSDDNEDKMPRKTVSEMLAEMRMQDAEGPALQS